MLLARCLLLLLMTQWIALETYGERYKRCALCRDLISYDFPINQPSRKAKPKMKFCVNILILLCAATSISAIKRRRCGVVVDKCQLLTNGRVFWPLDWKKECHATPICQPGYKLHKQVVGRLRSCCCVLKKIEYCPDCDMSDVEHQSFFEWIAVHLQRNGPADGKCPDHKWKRIFNGEGPNQLDKCCCEPKDTPFVDVFNTNDIDDQKA